MLWVLWMLAAGAGARGYPPPPFVVLTRGALNVRSQPSPSAPVVGTLRPGARLVITSCVPSCADPDAWGWMADLGAVRLSLTVPAENTTATEAAVPREVVHGKVLRDLTPLVESPEEGARVLDWEPAGRVLAFVAQAELDPAWLRRSEGGYVPAAAVQLLRPVMLRGQAHPSLPLAFLRRDAEALDEDGTRTRLAKYTAVELVGLTRDAALLSVGEVARGAVRVAYARPRPAGIPDHARWVHVDLREEVLTAYEGDVPVYAALVSTGKAGHATTEGVFRVWSKSTYGLMHGEGYFVEEVPFILYFHRSQGLHGAFWHDRFGSPITHGCVNLSLLDAEWLFGWAPPPLPAGWSSVLPTAEQGALWVQVERAPPGVVARRERPR